MRPSTPERLNIGPLLSSLGNYTKTAYFRRNQIVLSKGDRSDSIFYIQKGSVKLTLTSRQGKEAVIAVLAAGSLLGETAFASARPPRPNHAVALTDVRAVRIDPEAMLRLAHKNDDVCDAILRSLISLKTESYPTTRLTGYYALRGKCYSTAYCVVVRAAGFAGQSPLR